MEFINGIFVKKNYTILLLSAPIGSGHKLAAQALEQSFALADNVQVVHGSIFDFFPGSIGNAFLRFYLWVLSYCPWLYELVYKWGNRQSGSLWLRNFINGTLASLAQDFDRQDQSRCCNCHTCYTGRYHGYL